MNDILELRGVFEQKKNTSQPGAKRLQKETTVSTKDFDRLINNLHTVLDYFSHVKEIKDVLLSVNYKRVLAKSNRISELFKKGDKHPNDAIVGAKFNILNGRKAHTITYYLEREQIIDAIDKLKSVKLALSELFDGSINDACINVKGEVDNLDNFNFKRYSISKSMFRNVIVDVSFIDSFEVIEEDFGLEGNLVITIFETELKIKDLLKNYNIDVYNNRILDNTSALLYPIEIRLLKEKVPYLIAMETTDFSKLDFENFKEITNDRLMTIQKPKNEPTIGVIDTHFNNEVYFNEWVTYENKLDSNINLDYKDYEHGTMVSSLIVDGARLNPKLDDGLGHFKVRHFGVSTSGGFNSFSIVKKISEIVSSNTDIKVWNLSLGSRFEVHPNFISLEAAALDEIQFKYDVIFVIAGTNKKASETVKKVGSPADSINSVVVNSVDFKGKPANFSRRGEVLSFFIKPDVSYYGGGNGDTINVVSPTGLYKTCGTSFAAPFIARKLSYLIDVMGLSRETAKALLIDSAIGWKENSDFDEFLIGRGIVPIDIDEIVKSPKDEIKFIISGVSEKYDTYNHSFPIPLANDSYPFIAKATLAYFPKCSRNQGVDYTNTELDISFGRIDDSLKIKSLQNVKANKDTYGDYFFEEDLRASYRKWDNIKHVRDSYANSPKAKKSYGNKMWGMSIKTKERLNQNDGLGIRFGVVVTLKSVDGINRLDEFIKKFSLRGWLVNRVNVDNRIDIYEKTEQKITFE